MGNFDKTKVMIVPKPLFGNWAFIRDIAEQISRDLWSQELPASMPHDKILEEMGAGIQRIWDLP